MTRLGKRMFIIDMTHGRIMLSSETVVLQANGIPAMGRKGPITKKCSRLHNRRNRKEGDIGLWASDIMPAKPGDIVIYQSPEGLPEVECVFHGDSMWLTHLDDLITGIEYGVEAMPGEDFADYRLKVERYLRECGSSLVVQKLHRNLPMTEYEFAELERIFTEELGSADDYQRAYGDTPFGLLVRKLVKLDHDAAMEAFAGFINSQQLTEQQISFVRKVVDYVVENGYMEPAALAQPPFDRPQSFVRMFSTEQQMGLIAVIKKIKQNAEEPAA